MGVVPIKQGKRVAWMEGEQTDPTLIPYTPRYPDWTDALISGSYIPNANNAQDLAGMIGQSAAYGLIERVNSFKADPQWRQADENQRRKWVEDMIAGALASAPAPSPAQAGTPVPTSQGPAAGPEPTAIPAWARPQTGPGQEAIMGQPASYQPGGLMANTKLPAWLDSGRQVPQQQVGQATGQTAAEIPWMPERTPAGDFTGPVITVGSDAFNADWWWSQTPETQKAIAAAGGYEYFKPGGATGTTKLTPVEEADSYWEMINKYYPADRYSEEERQSIFDSYMNVSLKDKYAAGQAAADKEAQLRMQAWQINSQNWRDSLGYQMNPGSNWASGWQPGGVMQGLMEMGGTTYNPEAAKSPKTKPPTY